MSEMRDLLWLVIEQGVRPVLRRHRFKRPGGGSRFLRARDPLRQVIACRGTWIGKDRTGALELWIDQRVEHYTLWSLRSPKMHVDLLHGDPKDVAVGVAHWLETAAIPELDKPVDLAALGHAYEAERKHDRLALSAQVWLLLGFPEEAERVTALSAAQAAEELARQQAEGDLPF